MSDKNWIANVVRRADTPAKILKVIVENSNYLGDSYYRDLEKAMLDQAEKVLKEHRLQQRAWQRQTRIMRSKLL